MDKILAFFIATALVSLLVPRFGPFLSLVASAIIFGFMAGMGPGVMGYATLGLGRIFSSLSIVVFCGAIIAEYLRRTGSIDRIVSDLLRLSGRGMVVSGLAGYILSLPVMCSVTAFMILDPVVSSLGRQTEGAARRLQMMTAVCTIISFNLVYPSPVMVSLSSTLNIQPYQMLRLGLPISFLLLAFAYLYMLRLPAAGQTSSKGTQAEISRLRAWAPLVLPVGLIILGAIEGEALGGGLKFIGDPSIALLIGAGLGLSLARKKIQEMISAASRRAGIIMLDLCGAGAFGYVVSESGLGQALYASLGQALPILVLPFLLSALLQLAQGSRIVTVVVSAQILGSYPLDGLTLSFLICAGAFMFSYISDPYFWLVKESTGSSMKEMIHGYTLPLSLLGMAVFAMTALYAML